MSDQPKTYFILRPVNYKPNDFIRLGQVITDPRNPFERLDEPLPLKGPLKPRVSPAKEWHVTNSATGESSVGIFTHVFNSMKAGATAGQKGSELDSWEAALLETQFFEINEDRVIGPESYVERTAKLPRVQEWLRKNRRRGKTVYMITGLKVARNPGHVTFDSSHTSDRTLNFETIVDPHGTVKAGGATSKNSAGNTTQEETPQHAYVFAYRLRKLTVGWRNKMKLNLGETKIGGELYGVQIGQDRNTLESSYEDDDSFEMESCLLDEDDFGSELPNKDKKIVSFDEEDNITSADTMVFPANDQSISTCSMVFKPQPLRKTGYTKLSHFRTSSCSCEPGYGGWSNFLWYLGDADVFSVMKLTSGEVGRAIVGDTYI